MPLIVLRCLLLVAALGLAATVLQSDAMRQAPPWQAWAVLGGVVLLPIAVIATDMLVARKRIELISSVYCGLILGLILAYVLGLTLTPLVVPLAWQGTFNLLLAMVLCYAAISVLLQTRNDFRFVIPYVEFSREVKQLRPVILDTSVVIDGRIADVIETRLFDGQVIVPRYVVAELQGVADSSDKLRRVRGRRGLDILNRLRSHAELELVIDDRELPEYAGQPVDQKLVLLAKHIQGKVVTNDYNLNKVARLHGVEVINLNDIANALKPVFLPGEHLEVQVIRPGEQSGQGVGFLDDGTMVVIEGGRDHVQQQVRVIVTSVTQTSAGRMIFGRYEATVEAA